MDDNKEAVLAKYPVALCLTEWHDDRDYYAKDLMCTIHGSGLQKYYRIYRYPWSGYVVDMPSNLYLSARCKTEDEAWENARQNIEYQRGHR